MTLSEHLVPPGAAPHSGSLACLAVALMSAENSVVLMLPARLVLNAGMFIQF
jgi:hypothetical protein